MLGKNNNFDTFTTGPWHWWTSWANHLTRDQNTIIHGNLYISRYNCATTNTQIDVIILHNYGIPYKSKCQLFKLSGSASRKIKSIKIRILSRQNNPMHRNLLHWNYLWISFNVIFCWLKIIGLDVYLYIASFEHNYIWYGLAYGNMSYTALKCRLNKSTNLQLLFDEMGNIFWLLNYLRIRGIQLISLRNSVIVLTNTSIVSWYTVLLIDMLVDFITKICIEFEFINPSTHANPMTPLDSCIGESASP